MRVLRSFIVSLVVIVMMSASALATASAMQDEIASIKAKISSGYGGVRDALNDLQWSGYQDEGVYDLIADLLKQSYQSGDKQSIEHNSWYAKGLGFSGLKKYEALLEQVASSGVSTKLAKHATKAIENLNKYAEWNPVIAQGLGSVASGDGLEIKRVQNMLNSSFYELKRTGAKRVYYRYYADQQLLDKVEKTLLANYQKISNESLQVDALAWMCKVLGKSLDTKYADTLRKVADGSSSSKLIKHAKKELRRMS